MLFSSPVFVLFFVLYLFFHLAVPPWYRLTLIVIGGTVFYAYWNPYYVWFPHALTLIAYAGAQWMMKGEAKRERLYRASVTVVLLVIPLGLFKYANFVCGQIVSPLGGLDCPSFGFPPPLGISFITFTLIAYVVDVARGRFANEERLGMLSGLVLFFPHLNAGPILRPSELLPQLHRARRLHYGLFVLGLAIFSVGLVKKLVFADPLAEVVDGVFSREGPFTAPEYMLAIYGFAVQIYCDFSGYTDMAIGTALMLGIRLPINFMQPYGSSSIVEFWRRWHITLSRWLRDYIYIPLGGNRQGLARQVANVLATMVLGGLWHGANWTFILWGLLHGVAVSFVHALDRLRLGQIVRMLPRPILVFATFNFVVGGWILFRAADVSTALRVIEGPFVAPLGDLATFATLHGFQLVILAAFFLTHQWDNHRGIRRLVCRVPRGVFWPCLIVLWLSAIAVSAGSSANFIYFEF